MKTTKPAQRRNFLLAAGLGTAGVAAAVIAKSPVGATKNESKPVADAHKGYHVSEHILKYYKTTEV